MSGETKNLIFLKKTLKSYEKLNFQKKLIIKLRRNKMNVNSATNTNSIYFQGVRHIRKLQKTSKINLTINNTGNRSLSRVSSIDSKHSDDNNSSTKFPSAINNAIVKKHTISIYPTERNLSNSNAHSAKLLPSRDNSINSMSSSNIPKLPPATSSSKLIDHNEFLTPQRQNSLKIPTGNNPIIINNEKIRSSIKRNSEKLEKENASKQNTAYLKRPKFILKQKEMFHYGDKLHDLIEKEKKDYIQKKTQGNKDKDTPAKAMVDKINHNISE